GQGPGVHGAASAPGLPGAATNLAERCRSGSGASPPGCLTAGVSSMSSELCRGMDPAPRVRSDWLGTVSAACSAMKQTIRGMPMPNLQKAAWQASPPVAPVVADLRSPKPVAAGLIEPGG